MSSRPLFIMLCGVPGSGKTTYSRRAMFDHFVKLNTDDYLRKKMDEENISYKDSFNNHILQAEFELVENLKAAVKNKSNIIIDQLNLTPVIRRKKLLRVSPETYTRIAVGFRIDKDVILERNRERLSKNMGVPESILESYIEKFLPPEIKEGFDEIWTPEEIRS